MKRIFTLVFVALVVPVMAYGAQVKVSPPITEVTVYPTRATVTRAATVSLPRGESTIVLEGLSGQMDSSSLRVQAESTAQVTIVSMDTRRQFLTHEVSEEERKLTDELEQANDQRGAIRDRVNALNEQLIFIRAIAKATPKEVKEGMLRDDPSKWAGAWSSVGTGIAETHAAIQKERIARRELDRRISKLQQELNRIRTGKKELLDVHVHLSSDRAADTRVVFIYQVTGAGWVPVYDTRLDVEKSQVNLVQRADVRHRSGEDWKNVALTLSTARPARGVVMPEPEPWFVDFPRPRRQEEVAYKRSAASPGQLEPADIEGFFMSALNADTPASAPVAAKEAVATAVATEFTAEYRVAGIQSVPADGERHLFTVAEHTLPATLYVRTYPAKSPSAYLYARATFDGEAPLMGGRSTVFLNGMRMGSGRIGTLRPGEQVELPFGVDDRVQVTHQVDTDLRSRTGIIGKRRQVAKGYVISVENFHGRAVDVTVYDRLPVPQDEDIRVRLTNDSTAPDETDVEDAKGVLAWQRTLAPEGKATIRFGYEVSVPREQTVPGF